MLEINKIYCMDCIEGMKMLNDKSIDLILTDPPYGIAKEGMYGDESLDTFYRALPEMYRILKDDKWFITFFSIAKLPYAFIDNPFEYVWLGCIYYINKRRFGRCPIGANVQSLFLIFKKGNPKLYKLTNDVLLYTKMWKKNPPIELKVTSPKPVEPIERLIKAFSKEGDTILDPFMGSGTTAIACKKSGRDFIGFEIIPEYVEIAEERLKKMPRSLMGAFK